jgi:RNA polymerase sigma-70 factor (ECF subfamily)
MRLPVQQRLIIQMRDIEQYEFEEIAKILEMNESSIWRYLEQGKRYGLYDKNTQLWNQLK